MKPNLGDVIADKYRLDRVLGEGGMSMVFAAVNTLTGKPVAIKWLQPEVVRDEEQSQRLLREAQATSHIDHPNVVNVFDVGRHDGALFLVLELLHGEPLSELLMRGQQDPIEFVRLMMPVLRGVHAAHRAGVVHRDLKPDNIFFCRDPQSGEMREPKVLDFGISKLANDILEPGRELTREGTVFGTPQYMAPEQMRDARIADARSDVYALGVIFYRALTNAYPYDADTLTALAIRIVEGNAQPLHELVPHVQRGLSDLVMRALALDPEQRFQSVAELGTALEGYSDGLPFSLGSYERESATWLRRDSGMTALTADGTPSPRRLSPPPPPPRSSSTSLARMDDLTESQQRAGASGQIPTAALDPSELLVADPAPRTPITGRRLSIPPPPPPTPGRPSRGLDVVIEDSAPTQRVDRWSRRQTLWVGAALFAIGSVAPAGWQLWEKARGASEQQVERPRALVSGKSANVLAAMQQERPRVESGEGAQQDPPELAQDERGAGAPAAVTSAAPAAGTSTASAPAAAVPAAARGEAEAPAQELSETTTETSLPSGLSAPSAVKTVTAPRSVGRRAPASRSEAPAAPQVAPVQANAVEPGSEPAAVTHSERNPYLRR